MLVGYARFPKKLGIVSFYQSAVDAPVGVAIDLWGIKRDGYHAIHIHTFPTGEGGHFHVGDKWSPNNLWGTPHGDTALGICHTGDMCNNILVQNGEAHHRYTDPRISLYEGSASCVVGRSVVVHEGTDNYGLANTPSSKQTGDAGHHLAVAVITLEGECTDNILT